MPSCSRLALLVALCSCEEPPMLDERAVADPVGRVSDLSLVQLEDRRLALGWLESEHPGGAGARAAFVLLGPGGTPRGPVRRDDDESQAASALVETSDALVRVLAQQLGDEQGLVAVARDRATGELLADGYRTLPIFAGAPLSSLVLVKTARGALLTWIEHAGSEEAPADLVQLVRLGPAGDPQGPVVALTQLPPRIVRMVAEPRDGGQEVVLAVLAKNEQGSPRVWVFRVGDDEPLVAVGRQLTSLLGPEDRDLDLAGDDECLELAVSVGGRPHHVAMPPGVLEAAELGFAPLHADHETPGLAPRLSHLGRDRLLYLFDRSDGTTRVRAMEHEGCRAELGDDRDFPLDRTRCSSLVTLGGDPLLYGCATACLTRGCGEEWIWVGTADL